jgi:signal transduction histidine kinase
VTGARLPGRSPAAALLVGLLITLAIVVAYSIYISTQISSLRSLQTELTDRNRRDSLLLLRIQNNLNQIGLAMRDMLDNTDPYPLTAWSAQFERIRQDLNDAMQQQETVAIARRTPAQRQYLASSVKQFWDALDRMFERAKAGDEEEARAQIRLSLQARQAALSSTVARLLVQNNEDEEQTAQRVQGIYERVQRQVYLFMTATLAAIAVTGLYLIRSNRQLFRELAAISDRRRELAQKLIAMRESTLREISRELHDEFGQILTAIGSMLGRTAKQLPDDSPLRADLREIGEITQASLDKVRRLSQMLHPSILEELGLDSTIGWYLSTVEKQFGLEVEYARSGTAQVDDTTGIHVYRVLQEAVNNVARHSGTNRAWVRLRCDAGRLELEIEDHGRGVDPNPSRRGLGLVAMRERAELLGGALELLRPRDGGTLVRLTVPLSA